MKGKTPWLIEFAYQHWDGPLRNEPVFDQWSHQRLDAGETFILADRKQVLRKLMGTPTVPEYG
ncbi:hypothetical protein [Ensifer sp. ENS02]|uniref:hypothetical protein n=1 Tax=Ensifer sp. ENS02 TaxID=2769290 RepID=UPI001AEEDECE|nr:hypothetical protein [Ensifer sp. ENS02]